MSVRNVQEFVALKVIEHLERKRVVYVTIDLHYGIVDVYTDPSKIPYLYKKQEDAEKLRIEDYMYDGNKSLKTDILKNRKDKNMENVRKEIANLEERIREIENYIKNTIVVNKNVYSELSCLKQNLWHLQEELVRQKEKTLKDLIVKIEDISIMIGKTKIKISQLKETGNLEVAKKQEKYLYMLEQELVDLKIDKLSLL